MAPTKLSDSDKQAIVERYRRPEETASTLAKDFGVSNSTISRILKSALASDEYEALVQVKRSTKSGGSGSEPEAEPNQPTAEVVAPAASKSAPKKKSAAATPIELDLGTVDPDPDPVEPVEPDLDPAVADDAPVSRAKPVLKGRSPEPEGDRQSRRRSRSAETADTQLDLLAETPALTAALEEDEEDEEEDYLDGDDLEDDDDDFDDDYEEDEDDDDEDDLLGPGAIASQAIVQVLPMDDEALPRQCYLVVDRASELITLPLKDFRHLGQIPEAEVQELTLPIFDNHRIARRFSRRNQRVVKVPDGRMIEKTLTYLQAKGITRLLIDGQVYALTEPEPVG